MRWIGIDYGAKLAGTTCIAWCEINVIQVDRVQKGKDADAWLENMVKQLNPDFICIDAPLTLPAAYYNKGHDYFYRHCDRELQAMSPMFLGGLTARAIRLANLWRMNSIQVNEVYPKGLIQKVHTSLLSGYKNSKEFSFFIDVLSRCYPVVFPKNIGTWHEADAILAWCTGWRIQQKIELKFGNEDEGIITI